MTDQSKVAVAVPVHNGALHLRQCLECLARQETEDVRVLIFENASSDGSEQIAQEFCEHDPRFSFHPSDRLLGMWENFSRAIRLTSESGAFFTIRAHDDLSDTNFISALRQTLIDNPDAALAAPRIERIHADGTRYFAFKPELLNISDMAMPRKFRRPIHLPASWFYGLYRSSFAADVFLHSLSEFPYPWGGDRYILMQFLLRDQIVHDDSTTFRCRMGSGNESKYLRSEISKNLKIRSSYVRGLARVLFDNKNLTLPQRFALFGRVMASAPAHTHTSIRQIIERRM